LDVHGDVWLHVLDMRRDFYWHGHQAETREEKDNVL
jgi:hypothetical protein